MYAIVRLAKEFVVMVNNMVIARCTDFSFSINKDIIDITSFDSKGFKEKIADLKDWSISFGSMVTREYGTPTSGGTGYGSGVFNNLFDHFLTATADYPVNIAIGDPNGPTGSVFEGKGILQGLSFDGSIGDKMTYSGTIEGSGTLARV
jgi:predicted secreted protein